MTGPFYRQGCPPTLPRNHVLIPLLTFSRASRHVLWSLFLFSLTERNSGLQGLKSCPGQVAQ